MNDPKFPLAVEHSNPDSHLLNDKLKEEERNNMFPVLRILRKREFKPRESLMHQVFTSSDGFEKQSSLAGFFNLFILSRKSCQHKEYLKTKIFIETSRFCLIFFNFFFEGIPRIFI